MRFLHWLGSLDWWAVALGLLLGWWLSDVRISLRRIARAVERP